MSIVNKTNSVDWRRPWTKGKATENKRGKMCAAARKIALSREGKTLILVVRDSCSVS